MLSKASYWEQARRARLVEYEDLQVCMGWLGVGCGLGDTQGGFVCLCVVSAGCRSVR